MNSPVKIKESVLFMALVLTCSFASANGRQGVHYVRHTHTPTYVTIRSGAHRAARPCITMHISNSLTQKERLAMAVAFLNNNDYLSVKQYAKITGLSKDTAGAELEAFAADDKNQIEAKIVSRKKVYVKG